MNPVLLTLIIGCAAALGSVLRYGADVFSQWVRRNSGNQSTAFPWATLTVNVVGSALLGVMAGVVTHTSDAYAIVGIGFAGGLTTFSTWTHDTFALWAEGKRSAAVWNVVLNIVLGLGAAAVGYLIAR